MLFLSFVLIKIIISNTLDINLISCNWYGQKRDNITIGGTSDVQQKKSVAMSVSSWLDGGGKEGRLWDRLYLHNTGTGHTVLSTHNFKLSKYANTVSSGQLSVGYMQPTYCSDLCTAD